MAKAKPKAAANKAKTAVLAAQMKAKPKKPNPFELKGSKGHFDTIGKRVSGKKRNVIQARQDAVNRRKKTLLVEYRQLRKANTFVDRRFGESNPDLTETDKGIARLQAQRMKEERKKKKRGAKFTLSDGDGGDGGGLTHLGRSLADDIRGFMDRPEFDDLDEEMVEDLVAQYHFGGGGDAEGNAEVGGEEDAQARGPDGKPKTRKQIMEEIIAKSRMYRALKAKQREEDEAALETINEEFKELVRSAGLSSLIKAPGENKGVKVKADNPEDAAYDVAARELAFESKGAAGDRTLSPEELLEKERQRLEKLEKERLKRMRGADEEEGDDDDEEDDEEEDGADPRRKRRREMPSGDSLGDDYDSEGEDDEDENDDEEAVDANGYAAGAAEVSDLDRRRMKAAAGNHPLQESFRAAAAALAKKYGVEAPKNPYLDEGEEEGEEDGDEEEGEDEEEEEDEGASGGGSSSSGEGETEEDEDAEEEQLEQRRNPAHPPSTSRPGHGSSGGDPMAKARGVAAAEARSKKGTGPGSAVAAKPLDGPMDLPYTIPVPSSYNEFATLVNGRPAEDLHTAISRIRAFNAVTLAADSKRKMQEFYGILVQHFVMEASTSPLPVASLDTLTRVLLELTPEVPYYAATVARARLGRMAEQLTVALAALGGVAAREAAGVAVAAATAASTPASPWPSSRVVLQLRLFLTLFPISDRRHPVLTPLALLIGKYLHQCIVSNPHEAAVGLCLCGLMTHMAAPAHRTTPEPLVFLRDCLGAFLPEGPAGHGAPSQQKVGSSAGGGNGHPKLASSGAKRKGGLQPAIGFSGGEAPEHTQQHQQQRDPDAFVRFAPGLLALSTKGPATEAPPPLGLYEVLAMSASDPRVSTDAFKLGLFRIAMCAVRRAAALTSKSGLVCFEQLFAPLVSVVSELKRIEHQLPEELRLLRGEIYRQLSDASVSCVASRRPMVHATRARATTAAVREFNPRFEDGFVSGRDYDPDRQRVETRRLKRAIVKERRGAIRELRRDAVFMAEERDRETARVDAERLESERRFYSELQRQEADMRSGGQGGMNPHLKKKRR
ncbi:hypothetical protein Vafri_6396 [Volvox africanus]|uniref:Nucleolar protein 14 n=1 Tax=Volvox africanus TaxID=51714 RepID=A0A8J4AZZ9_9CHLO|nr:hypothetical protein Vafri_6396 [Volvox africanus]